MALDEKFMVKLVSDTISTLNNRKLNNYKEPILQYIEDNKITKTRFLKYKENSFTKILKSHLQKKSMDSDLSKLYNSLNTHFEPTYTVGDVIKLDIKNTKNTVAIIRFIGEIQGKKGIFYGLELNTANGTCDGTLNKVQYFQTQPKYAIFIKKKQYETQLLQNSDNIRVTVPDIVYIDKLQCNAVIRFIGFIHFKNDNNIWYGVQLEQAKGKNNGTIKDRKYFQCQDKYGLFLKANDIIVIDRNKKYLDNSDNSSPEPLDDISYASSADFAEYDDAVERIHFFVMDKNKADEFKEPIFANDIHKKDDRYVGMSERQIDITDNLKKLQLTKNDCKVMAFKEVQVNEQCVLERVFDNKYFETDFEFETQNEIKIEEKNDETATELIKMKTIAEDDDNECESEDDHDTFQMVDFALLRQKSKMASDKSNQLKALRMKYSSRKVILHGKCKEKQPKCEECDTYYHIQSDPLNAYDGVGIICEICGKNRRDNPELILEDTYYTCEGCGGLDICKSCYMKQKKALKQQFSK